MKSAPVCYRVGARVCVLRGPGGMFPWPGVVVALAGQRGAEVRVRLQGGGTCMVPTRMLAPDPAIKAR